MLQSTMSAIQYQAYGGFEKNQLATVAVPQPKEGEVLLEMRTVGVNPLDHTFLSGNFYAATPENLPRIGGQTGVGVVVQTQSPDYSIGDRVVVSAGGYGLTVNGTWAEYMTASAQSLNLVPDRVGDDDAAAFVAGYGYLTGYLALTRFARFQPGQTVLAPGIGGAVGMETIQIARRLGASLAISTASTTEKVEQARAAGYEHVIDLSKEGLKEGVLRITGGKGVDVIVDGVSGKLTGEELGSLAKGGMLVVVGYSGGRMADIDVTDIIWKSAQIRGFSFSIFDSATIKAAQMACLKFLEEGSLQPTIADVFPLSQAANAMRHLIEGRPFGRILIKVNAAQQNNIVTIP